MSSAMQRVRLHNSSADDNWSSLGGTDARTRNDPGARSFTTRMHTTLMLPEITWDMRSSIARCPLAAPDWTRSMRRPSRGEEDQDDRVAAVELREADEEAVPLTSSSHQLTRLTCVREAGGE